jgi:molecular chaperone GrpE
MPSGDSQIEEATDVESLKKVLEEEKTKAERYLANWQRSQADFANYKKRADQDKLEYTKFASAKLMASILPVIDDFERALASLPSEVSGLSWTDGLALIQRKLRAVLEAEGVSEIKAVGEPFDPLLHEAVMQGDGEEGKVVQELQKGYRMHDRVLRPTMVVVGNGKNKT